MAEAADQFGDFFPTQNQPDQWADFNPQTPKEARESQIPESFVHRLYMGLSLRNVAEAAAKGAKEGFGQSPIGENFLPHEEIRKAMDAGLFYDPTGGKTPKTWQLLTEAAIRAGAWTADLTMRGVNSAIYGGGEVAGEVTGDPKIRNEAINLANFMMISGGMGTFSRPASKLKSPIAQVVGGIPKAEDFSSAATVIAGGDPALAKTAESNLYDLWHDRGAMPVEASHDSHVDAFLKHRLNTPPIDVTDHSGIPPVRNSPVPEGTPRSALAVTDNSAINSILADRQTKAAIDNPAVNRANDVPYGAAPDAMGNGLNIDRRIPATLTIDGTTFDPADPLAVREFVERDTAEKLIAGGMERDAAHAVARAEYAERAEAAWYVSHGIDKSKADAALRPFIDEINHEAPGDPPPNIYQRPADSRGPTLQDIHEDDANSIPAKEGEPARDRVVAERDRYAQEQPPEIKAGLEAAARQAGYETKPREPIGEGGAGPGGPSEVVGGGGAAEHIAPGGAGGMEPGAIVESGANLGPEGVALPRAGERPGTPARGTSAAGYPSGEMIAQAKNILEREVAAPPATPTAPPAGATVEGTPAGAATPWEQITARAQAEDKALEENRRRAVMGLPQISSPIHVGEGPAGAAALEMAHPLGADVTGPLTEAGRQLPTPVGRLVEAAQNSLSKLFDIGLDIQRMIAPMATGLKDAKRFAKDFENTMYRIRWEWAGADDRLAHLKLEQQKRMWEAADEESVLLQEIGRKPGANFAAAQEHMGLATLTAEERAAVEHLQADAQMTWVQAREVGMVKGEGLPSYTPRMVINMAGAMGGEGAIPLNGLKLRVRTAQMMFRKHLTAEETEAAAKAKLGEGAEIVRNIRTLPWATARLKEAIATRHMINRLKELGDRTGSDLVAEGFQPDQTWWTDQNSPAFKTWSPKFVKDEATGKIIAVKDADGNTVFIQTPIYLRGDTEGPVRAVASVSKGPQSYAGSLYGALMALKGKAMQLIMYSPTVHNAVEWGRALPAMPGKVASFKVYFDGNRAKNNPAVMGDAIDHGMAPIGKRFFNQDITSMMEEPSLTPGRSFTSKVLGFVPGLFDPAYETAVRAAVDKLGDFRSNTLLWDRVADLQMGLYTNFKDEIIAKGQDPSTAAYMAAHWANRYAGSLPRSAMSEGARRFANLVWFSRSFTLGNLGVMKDAVGHLGPAIWNPLMEMLGRDDLRMDVTGGLPRAVLAQIETEGNKLMPSTVAFARNMAIRKAVSVVIADIGLYYIGNSVLQSVMNVIRGDSTASEEMRQYADRLIEAITKRVEHPLSLLQPFDFMGSLSATSENEPNKEGRIRVGTRADGTAVYARLTPGKIGEEFISWPTGPLDMAKRKESTFARPLWEIFANDKGFGRHVYDPYADTPLKYAKVGIDVAWHLTKAQVEQTSVGAAYDLLRGQGDWLTVAQLIGPWVGVTFSRGAPGGPAMGEYHRIHDEHQQQIMNEMPQIKEMIRNGNFIEAQQKMRELNLERGFQRSILRGPHLSARALREIHNSGTPQQILRFDRALEQQRQNSE